jgi:serine/threonine-protein kinase
MREKTLVILILILALFSGCSSSANDTFTVAPNIEGLKISSAEQKLSEAGLILQIADSQYSENIPLDCIISQDPSPGTSLKNGSIVKAIVSNGAMNVTVPDIKNKLFEDAFAILKNIGLTIGEINEIESDEKVGTVIFQDPEPGTFLTPGSSVKVTVSIGRFIVVPNVIGLNVEEAKNILINLGLAIYKVEIIDKGSTVPSGIVLYQYPFPNAKVDRGALVLLRVSK